MDTKNLPCLLSIKKLSGEIGKRLAELQDESLNAKSPEELRAMLKA